MKDFEKDLLALGPYPSAPTPPPPPQTLDDAIALLAYGDRGVVDRPAVIAFIVTSPGGVFRWGCSCRTCVAERNAFFAAHLAEALFGWLS